MNEGEVVMRFWARVKSLDETLGKDWLVCSCTCTCLYHCAGVLDTTKMIECFMLENIAAFSSNFVFVVLFKWAI